MKDIEINTADYPLDVERIQQILAKKGYKVSLKQSEELWDKYSDRMSSSWMILSEKDNEVFEAISSYISN